MQTPYKTYTAFNIDILIETIFYSIEGTISDVINSLQF